MAVLGASSCPTNPVHELCQHATITISLNYSSNTWYNTYQVPDMISVSAEFHHVGVHPLLRRGPLLGFRTVGAHQRAVLRGYSVIPKRTAA